VSECYLARLWISNVKSCAVLAAALRSATLTIVHPLLRTTSHRPWPLPPGHWIMRQIWHDLLFAHWPLSPALLRPLVPSPLDLDVFDGRGWVGVVPFRMSGIHARGLPPAPGLSRFPELNVRTYVTYRGQAGVYFFSLDAANLPAVWAARRFYQLRYFHAAMKCTEPGGTTHYFSRRYEDSAEFRGSYSPLSQVRLREKGSIEHWLTERYCLYTTRGDTVFRCDIHHPPWPLQEAQAEIEVNTMAAAAQIDLPAAPPLLHFAKRLEVLIWPLRPANQSEGRV
jgi:uncharacterized protein